MTGHPTQPQHRNAARAALVALHQARTAVRQHAAGHRLRQDALRQFAARAAAATATGSLDLQLVGNQARIGDEVVWEDPEPGGVVGALTRLGVGRLTVAPDTPPATLMAFAELLAADAGVPTGDEDLVSTWQRLHPEGIELGVATADQAGTRAPRRDPWETLPPPGPTAAALAPALAHEQATNLPAVAARWLLADLEHTAMDPATTADRLLLLIDGMLARADVAGCTWLLEQTQQHGTIDATTALAVRGRVQAGFASNWLPALLRRGPDDPMGLLALAMQLGDDAVRTLATTAAAAGQPLPPWLLDLVPPPPPLR